MQELKEVLNHFDVQKQKMCQLTADSNKCNALGRRYTNRCFSQIVENFVSGRGSRTWTENAQKTVNDHLDVLVDYLSKSEEQNEPEYETHVICFPILKERLEKERSEGKWPSVDERIKEKTKNVSKQLITRHIDIPEIIESIDEAGETNKVHIKRIKKHKKHRKSNNIYITINIGR